MAETDRTPKTAANMASGSRMKGPIQAPPFGKWTCLPSPRSSAREDKHVRGVCDPPFTTSARFLATYKLVHGYRLRALLRCNRCWISHARVRSEQNARSRCCEPCAAPPRSFQRPCVRSRYASLYGSLLEAKADTIRPVRHWHTL